MKSSISRSCWRNPERWGRAFKKAVGKGTQNLDTSLEIPPGFHTIEARLFNEAKSRELVEQVEVDLESGQVQELLIVAGGAFGRRLEPPPEATP